MVHNESPQYLRVFLLVFWLGCSGCGEEPFQPQGTENNLFDGEGGGTWEEVAPIATGPRQEVGVAVIGDEMYVVGGANEALQFQASVEVYHPQSDTWRSAQPLPLRMHHANVAAWNDKLYVLGFLTDRSFTPHGRSFVYDPQTDTWDEISPLPNGTERGASAVGVIEDKIYVAGGLRGNAVRDFSRYDPQTDTWEILPSMPDGLDHLGAGVIRGVLYTVGGRRRSIGAHQAVTYAFDPTTSTWQQRASMPTSRAGLAAAVLRDKLYVFGGEGNPAHRSQVFRDTEVYDPATDAWEVLRPMLTRRHGTGAATLGDKIYIPGGAALVGFSAIDIHEVYTPLVPGAD